MKKPLFILSIIAVLAINDITSIQAQEQRNSVVSTVGQKDTGMDDLRNLFYFGMAEQDLVKMLIKDHGIQDNLNS